MKPSPQTPDLFFLLHRRLLLIALVALPCLLVWLFLQARQDIRDEIRGADETAAILTRLLALQGQGGTALDEGLADLTREARQLRHLRLRIIDGGGQELIPVAADADSLPQRLLLATATETVAHSAWLRGSDGRDFRILITPTPQNEAREALATLTDLLLWAGAYTAALLAGLAFALHRAFAPLRSIVQKVADCMSRNGTTRLPAMAVRELDVIAQALNQLGEALDQAEAGRRELNLKLVSVQEEARSHLVRELHDEFGQNLTAMRANAAYLARSCRALPSAGQVAEELESQCSDLHGGLRDLLRRLQPLGGDPSQPVPLKDLLARLVDGWRQLPGHTASITFTYALSAALPSTLALALYRMTQEALTNIARHAHASQVTVAIGGATGHIHWQVSDNGHGIPDLATALQRGSGLAGLRERVWAHGGEFRIDTPSGGGLILVARFPLQRTSNPAHPGNAK